MKTKAIASIMIVLFLASMLSISVPIVEASPADLHVYAPTQLTTDGGHYLGSFSPDGTKIVYTEAGTGIWVMNPDGTGEENIYSAGDRPDWGPPIDGYPEGLIALAGTGITIITPDGDVVKSIDITHPYPPDPTRTATLTHSLDWSSDGGKIAFATSQWTSAIWTVDYNTETLTKITDYSKPAYSPTWSPDRTEIACSWGSSTNMFVGVFKSDGTQTTPLRTIGVGGSYGGDYPDWGSNGKIVYSVGAAKQLYVMDGDGSNNVKIFDGPAVMAAWSIDCAKILYIDGFANKNVWVRGRYSTIQSAILAASPGDTIYVHPGTYPEIVAVHKPVSIMALMESNKPFVTAFHVQVSGVTISGFRIGVASILGELASVYLAPVLSDIEISDNEMDGGGSPGSRGVLLGLYGSGSSYSDVYITHNVIHDLTTGIYTNPHGGIVNILYNEIYDTLAGIGGATGVTVMYNTFHDNGEAIGADDYTINTVIHYNNIFDNTIGVKNYGPTFAVVVDAEYNWWGSINGPYDPVGTVEMPYEPEPSVSDMKNTEPVGDLGDEVSEHVDYYPWLGAPFEIYTALEDLKTEIDDLSDADFKPPAADRTAALLDKINDVIAKIDAGDYQGAIMKLNMDIKPKLDYSAKQAWLVTDHPELLDKITVIVGILQGML